MTKHPPHKDFTHEHHDLTEIARRGIAELKRKHTEDAADQERVIRETEEALRRGGVA